MVHKSTFISVLLFAAFSVFGQNIPHTLVMGSQQSVQNFSDTAEIRDFIVKKQREDFRNGFLTASLDSQKLIRDTLISFYYTGPQLGFIKNKNEVLKVAGISLLTVKEYDKWKSKKIEELENSGYPFAEIKLEQNFIEQDTLH